MGKSWLDFGGIGLETPEHFTLFFNFDHLKTHLTANNFLTIDIRIMVAIKDLYKPVQMDHLDLTSHDLVR